MGRRPGRKRSIAARRRNRWVDGRRAETLGPTPEMARRRLAEAGLLGAAEAFGAGLLDASACQTILAERGLRGWLASERLIAEALAHQHAERHQQAVQAAADAGRPLPVPLSLAATVVSAQAAEMEGQRLDDKAVLRMWWDKRPSTDREVPLDVLVSRLLIEEAEWAAGMRYGRLVWRLAGLPFHPVEKLYRHVGLVEDDRKSSDLTPEESEEREERTEEALRVAVLAVRTEAPPGALHLLGEVAAYFQSPWPNVSAIERQVIEADARFRALRRALRALVSVWGMRR